MRGFQHDHLPAVERHRVHSCLSSPGPGRKIRNQMTRDTASHPVAEPALAIECGDCVQVPRAELGLAYAGARRDVEDVTADGEIAVAELRIVDPTQRERARDDRLARNGERLAGCRERDAYVAAFVARSDRAPATCRCGNDETGDVLRGRSAVGGDAP